MAGPRARQSHRGAAAVLLLCGNVAAAEELHRKGHGEFRVGYQYIAVENFEGETGTVPIGTTDTHALTFGVEYALTERVTLDASLPLIRKRWNGETRFAHDPRLIDPPPQDAEFIDDGQYHTSWQDLFIGVRYLAHAGVEWSVAPFVTVGYPTNDYPFFAHAAVGQNLWSVDVGAEFGYRPLFSDWYYTAEVSHVFMEETLGVSVDHWRLHAEVGRFLTRAVTVRGILLARDGDGLRFPTDYEPPPRTSPFWYQHDRMNRHNHATAGIGIDWYFGGANRLSFSALQMFHADNIHDMRYALTVGYARGF